MWPQVRARLAGDPLGQALLDALDGERTLLGPPPAPARLLYQRVWLPRYTRTVQPL
jgi:hypothetical protein